MKSIAWRALAIAIITVLFLMLKPENNSHKGKADENNQKEL